MAGTVREPLSRLLKEYGVAFVFAVAIGLAIRWFGVEVYRISSPAMRPVLEPGDTVFVTKYTFGLRSPFSEARWTQGRMPRRGEVVLFAGTDSWEREFVKRVVGLPGDRVEFRRGRLFLNGRDQTVEAPLHSVCGKEQAGEGGPVYSVCWEPPVLADTGVQAVPAGYVYVASDLRTETKDLVSAKASFGLVALEQLRGKVQWIWLSLDPSNQNPNPSWFPRIRFERMFRKVQ